MIMPSRTSLWSPEFSTANNQAATKLAATATSAPPYSALNAMTGAGFGQIARQRCDHEHGFEPLAEQDDGGLDEC